MFDNIIKEHRMAASNANLQTERASLRITSKCFMIGIEGVYI